MKKILSFMMAFILSLGILAGGGAELVSETPSVDENDLEVSTMAVVENKFVCDLQRPVQAQALKGNVFSLDNFGSRLSVLIYENGVPATISGSITADCILPDGSTVTVNGSLTTENGGSKAYIDVPQSCLLIPGILKVAIKCTSSSVITTLAAIVANVYMTKTDNVITPSQQIINDWNAEISASLATIGTVPSGKTVVGMINDEATARENADADLKSAIRNIDDVVFEFDSIPVYATATGWRLNESDGLCSSDAGYKLIKYQVNAGDYVRVETDDRFQFQNSASVPASGTNNRIGKTYQGSISIVKVPDGATYLIVSSTTDGVQNAYKGTGIDKRVVDIEEIIENDLIQGERYQIPLTMGYASGYVDRYKVFQTYAGISAASIEVSEGDIYYLTSKNLFSGARAVFYNSSDVVESVVFTANNGNLETLTKIIVPENAVKMLIQSFTSEASYVALYKQNLSEKFAIISEDIGNIEEATTDPLVTDVPLTFESASGYIDKNKSSNTYSGVTTATINVSAGQRYLLETRNYFDAALACLYADSTIYSVVWLANNDNKVIVEIEIPLNITKLVIQRFSAYYPTRLGLITGIEKKPAESILNGKKITVIGDSITEKNFRAKVNWVRWIGDWCGAEFQNLGAGGTGFYNGVSSNKNYYARLSSIQATPDIIGVALSWNDLYDSSFPIGTATDTGTGSLAGYANDFFSALLTSYPTTPIICYCQSPWGAYHYGAERSDSWFSVLSEICALKGIPFYGDMYKGSTLKPWIAANKTAYYTPDDVPAGESYSADDVHPNSEGHKIIARYLYPKFAENLVTTGLEYK